MLLIKFTERFQFEFRVPVKMRKMNMIGSLIIATILWNYVNCSAIKVPKSHTSVTTNNSTGGVKSYIEFGIINKQHHLYIGRCNPSDVKFHGENIILNNTGDNHVTAVITINVESNVYITCVNILDQIPNGEGGYPGFLAGGVGYNFVQFEVRTEYGKGFNFYVEIFGYYL